MAGQRRLATGAQDSILPHNLSDRHSILRTSVVHAIFP